MPTPHYDRIKTFMQQAGQETPARPVEPDENTRILRAKLILEEALETVEALGVKVTFNEDGQPIAFEPGGKFNMEEVVDGCADISVVTIGTLIALGVDDEPILEEVDAANLRKFGPGGRRRADGKWLKPPDWTPPDLMARLKAQGY